MRTQTAKAKRYNDAQRFFVAGVRVLLVPVLVFLFCSDARAQVTDSSFSLVRSYKGDVAGAAVDNLDNLYIISSTGQVKKIGPKGDSIGVFSGVRAYGKLATVDVTNPLRPLLFYKDFSNVVVLDRFLASRASLNLRRFGILQPTTVGLSYDNNIWVFDQYDNRLKKIDEAGSLLLQTDDFRTLFGQSLAPQKIINENGLVYLADSAVGVYVFDNYGTFKRRLPLKSWRAIDIAGGRIVWLSSDAVVVYNPVNFSERRLPFSSSFRPYLHSFTSGNRLVTFTPDSLRVYRVGD